MNSEKTKEDFVDAWSGIADPLVEPCKISSFAKGEFPSKTVCRTLSGRQRARRANHLQLETQRASRKGARSGNRTKYMSEQDGRWDALEQALLALDDRAMVLEELDGFIAGLLVSPEPIPPGEWFARVVGLPGRRASPFANLDHANDVLDLVMNYYNAVATTLARHPEGYQPRFPVDDQNGDVIWELWIDGFAAAINLRRQAFETYVEAEGEVANAALDMMAFIGATLEEDPDPKEYESFSSGAPDLIRQSIVTLHQHRQAMRPTTGSIADQPNPFADARKVGRNEPCPCGSGRKYKRCCGAL